MTFWGSVRRLGSLLSEDHTKSWSIGVWFVVPLSVVGMACQLSGLSFPDALANALLLAIPTVLLRAFWTSDMADAFRARVPTRLRFGKVLIGAFLLVLAGTIFPPALPLFFLISALVTGLSVGLLLASRSGLEETRLLRTRNAKDDQPFVAADRFRTSFELRYHPTFGSHPEARVRGLMFGIFAEYGGMGLDTLALCELIRNKPGLSGDERATILSEILAIQRETTTDHD